MLDVFKAFYSWHYNLAVLSGLLFLLTIFLLSKKNLKVAIVVLAAFIALNVCIYKKTANTAWTITLSPEQTAETSKDGMYHQAQTMTFSVAKWTITDDQGEVHHWCWVEDIWESISNTDIVAGIWGENASKNVQKSTESRVDEANNQN